MKLSRREFIAASGLFALSAGRVRANRKMSVTVLGAGLAGLSAAYQLAKNGFEVTVVEARDRVGGRVFTLRTPFDDGLITETGGELIGDDYKRFLGYADEFGIGYSELRAEAETGGSVSDIQDGIGRNAYMKGRFFRKGDVITKHPYGLKGDEAQMLPPTLLGKYLRLINNEIREGKTTLAELDRVSLAEALRSRGVSKKAVKLINISLNYNSVYTASAAGVLHDGMKRRSAGTVPLRLEGGNDKMTKALADASRRLGAEIVLRSPVSKIERTAGKVSVWCRNGPAGLKKFEADRVVCTIPYSVLRNIPVTPAFELEKQRAINELGYTRVTKVFMQAKFVEWDKRSLGSSIWTDTPIERIFSTTGKTGDQRALFTVWTEGDGSRKLQNMNAAKRISYAVSKFEKVLPFMRGAVEKSDTLSWSQEPFSKGAYAHFEVGQFNSLSSVTAKSDGRIHFAGEHTAVSMPGMEGALESAERVVSEITR